MTPKDGWREVVRGALFDNLGLKVIALVCALLFYAFNHGAENAQRTFRVSVVSLMPPDSANRQLMTQLPTEVAVTVKGSRRQLADLRADDLGSLQLDMRSGRETRIKLEPSMFHLPTSLGIEQIYPAAIDLRWDDVVERQIPVQIARTGEPAPGFSVRGTTTADPPAVRARGPRSVVDVMQFARAAPFDVTGLSEGVYKRPLALDMAPKLVNYDAESVVATVEIGRELVKKEIMGRKVEVVGVPRAKVDPATVKIEITATAEDLAGLMPEAIIPRVEPKATGADIAQPGSAYLDVLVDVPHRSPDSQAPKVVVTPPKVLVKW